MRPDRKIGTLGFARFVQAGFFASLTVFGAGQLQAQSAYDCRGLEAHLALPSVEGRDGTFFAIHPELQSHHGLGKKTISMLSDLDAALGARGTTLVLLPVPTRAQVLAHQLPPMAAHLGYNVEISIAVHIDMIRRLKKAGLTVADPLSDLRTAALSGARPFFEADPRLTTVGTRVLAKTVAAVLAQHPSLANVSRGTFSSVAGKEVALVSTMRAQLQTACQLALPDVITQGFVTLKDTDGDTASGTDATTGHVDTVVVVGTGTTATNELNLTGFLKEATGINTFSYGVSGGGAFAAISSYMTSVNFQSALPSVLVWEFPVSAPMANHGDQPLRELVVAATNMCGSDIPVTRTSNGDRLRADISQLPGGTELTLLLDAGEAGLPFVRFHFTGVDGLIRTRSLYRHPDQALTGRFYLPLSGLKTTDLSTVEIEGSSPFGLQSRLEFCS